MPEKEVANLYIYESASYVGTKTYVANAGAIKREEREKIITYLRSPVVSPMK